MADLTVYEKPTCTTCRNLAQLLQERGVDFERVNYHVDPLPEAKIRELLGKAGISARDALRTREPVYAELGLADRDVPEDELIALGAEPPSAGAAEPAAARISANPSSIDRTGSYPSSRRAFAMSIVHSSDATHD